MYRRDLDNLHGWSVCTTIWRLVPLVGGWLGCIQTSHSTVDTTVSRLCTVGWNEVFFFFKYKQGHRCGRSFGADNIILHFYLLLIHYFLWDFTLKKVPVFSQIHTKNALKNILFAEFTFKHVSLYMTGYNKKWWR